jgi:hypothetical protein
LQKSAGPGASSNAQPPSSSGKNNPDGSSKIPASTTPPSAGATPTSSGALQTSMTGSGNVRYQSQEQLHSRQLGSHIRRPLVWLETNGSQLLQTGIRL